MQILAAFTAWLIPIVLDIWQAFSDYSNDLWIDIAEAVLSSIASTFLLIPVPHFLDLYSIGSILSFLPSDVLYFVGILNLPTAIGLISSAFSFRMIRKVFTLFQW